MRNLILYESFEGSIDAYIRSRKIKPDSKYPHFLWHATSVKPSKFAIDPNLDWEDAPGGNVWDFELPSGVLFLSNDPKEVAHYGRYVIPFELDTDKILVKKIDGNNPSQVFDEDYNYGSKYNIWSDFTYGNYHAIEVRGHGKSTFIAYFDFLKPRTDIAREFYE